MKSLEDISRIGIEGALLVLSPFPLLFPLTGPDIFFNKWQLVISLIAVTACLVCAFTMSGKHVVGKVLGMVAAAGAYLSALPNILINPFAALTANLLLISATVFFIDFHPPSQRDRKSDLASRYRERAWWGAMMIPAPIVISLFLGASAAGFSRFIVLLSLAIALILYLHWALESKSTTRITLTLTAIFLLVLLYVFSPVSDISGLAMLSCLTILISFPNQKGTFEKQIHWWEILLNNPARVLLTTFLALCVFGSFLLALPVSNQDGAIDLVDAVFTSVSAVCVTGLIVLDTPHDFTMFGQFCILLLIQFGGLGIMSITAVTLHMMGRRLSLKQERMLTSMTDTGHKDLLYSLKTILKFTFIAEAIGAAVLVPLFYAAGDSLGQATWRGLFTAVSAFCNAGFALQSDSLLPYQTNVLILHAVSTLIIFGGIAPATSLLVPQWISGKPVPIAARIALVTTVVLLLSGCGFMMAFEWDGILSGLSVGEKIQNAWFQSVTLRTAGFNSVDITTIANPTFMVMVIFMFIGGSPGGTAGGVKTTTIGILAMTFWANITNRNDVEVQNRLIHSSTIYRAITIVASGMAVWFVVILMLQVTQQISARDLIFEVTSALGTVGLSTGATSLLDEIGKAIIIITMFVGRIGPMTIFMLLSGENAASTSRCPEEKISIT
jgi:trk system potassium uptake protein TrkH